MCVPVYGESVWEASLDSAWDLSASNFETLMVVGKELGGRQKQRETRGSIKRDNEQKKLRKISICVS